MEQRERERGGEKYIQNTIGNLVLNFLKSIYVVYTVEGTRRCGTSACMETCTLTLPVPAARCSDEQTRSVLQESNKS